MIEDDVPWLPCRWCGWMPVGCTCTPITTNDWEAQLDRAETVRIREQHAAEWRALRDSWAAA